MKTEGELNRDILFITMKIHKEFPELSKYLIETPINFFEKNSKEINKGNLEDYHNSLLNILKGYSIGRLKMDNLKLNEMKKIADKSTLTGYPVNPSSEDAYNNWKEETELNPEDITKKKTPNELPNTRNEEDFTEDMSGSDLDIPGSELDDEQENVGSEDEENNYYSLGGDNHNDLEEDKA